MDTGLNSKRKRVKKIVLSVLGVLISVALVFVIRSVYFLTCLKYDTTHITKQTLFYGTEWKCDDPEITIKVYASVLGTRGKMNVNGEELTFIVYTHGGASWVAFCPEFEDDYDEQYYLTGGAYWEDGNYCIKVSSDYIGLGAKKLVFKKVMEE